MHSASVFDHKAEQYDHEFTTSYVGKAQRKAIQDYIASRLWGKKDLNILELNCGTGEDISFLEQFGNVTATDVSEGMLRIAKNKNPHTLIQKLDLNRTLPPGNTYDVVFSNFGGLNCIAPERLMELNKELYEILNPGGHAFLVFIHRWSLVEFVYFLFRVEFKKAFRRLSGKTVFNNMPVFYYSKRKLIQLFHSFFLVQTIPVGILLAGEYMNAIGKKYGLKEKNKLWLKPVFGADHVLYAFTK